MGAVRRDRAVAQHQQQVANFLLRQGDYLRFGLAVGFGTCFLLRLIARIQMRFLIFTRHNSPPLDACVRQVARSDECGVIHVPETKRRPGAGRKPLRRAVFGDNGVFHTPIAVVRRSGARLSTGAVTVLRYR